MKMSDKLLSDLFTAYFDARKHKRNTINQLRFEINYESNLIELCEDILNYRYQIRPSICFIVNAPVKREIFAADFRDRVIHHLIYNYISPFYEKQFVKDSYSCRKEKGTHYGIKRIYQFIKKSSQNYTQDCFVLKLDIEGYFMNMDRLLLLSMLEEYLAPISSEEIGMDKKIVSYLIECVLNDDPTQHCIVKGNKNDWTGLPHSKSLFYQPKGKGLPIGNLTSQLFSNIYLHVMDDYIKNTLQIDCYGRYVDDFIIVHKDKEYLKELRKSISAFLEDRLMLRLHPKKIYLQHYTKGVPFLGAIIKPHRIYIAKRTKGNFINSLKKWEDYLSKNDNPSRKDLQQMASTINSYLGIMGHYRTYNIRKKALLDKSKSSLIYKYGYLQVKPYKKMKYVLNREC